MQTAPDQGIVTRGGNNVGCSHRGPVYSGAALRCPLPHSEAANDPCIILALYPRMTPAEQERVAAVLGQARATEGRGAAMTNAKRT
jgi:dTDP-4-amino-4,6-dideoxygalactose transaminase